MKLHFRLIFMLIFSFSLSSCEPYEPQGENFVEVAKPELNVGLQLNNKNPGVTFSIYGQNNFTISRNLGNKRERELTVFVDEKLVGDFTFKDSFSIDGSKLSDGTHAIKIKLITSTSSGSLADKLKTEFITYSPTWSLVVDKQLPGFSNPLTYTIEDGFLVINWQKYSGIGFEYYNLKYIDVYRNEISNRITDINTTSFKILTIPLNPSTVAVELAAKGKKVSSPLLNLSIPTQINLLSPERINEQEYKFTWSRPILYGPISEYTVSDLEGWTYGRTSDSTMTCTPTRIGQGVEYKIVAGPFSSNSVKINLGTRNFNNFSTAWPDVKNNRFLYYNFTLLTMFGVSGVDVSTKLSVPQINSPAVSQDMTYFAGLSGKTLYGNFWKQIDIYRTSDFTKIQSINLDDFYPSIDAYVNSVIMNGDHLVFNIYENGDNPNEFEIKLKFLGFFSISTGKKVKDLFYLENIKLITSDAKRAITSTGSVYDISGISAIAISNVPLNGGLPQNIISNPIDNSFIGLYADGRVTTFDLTPNVVVRREFTFGASNWINFIGFSQNQDIVAVEIASRIFFYNMFSNVHILSYSYEGECYLYGDYLVTSLGYVVKWR